MHKTKINDFLSCQAEVGGVGGAEQSRRQNRTKQDERENDHLSLRHFKERSVPWRQLMPVISAPIAPACSQITHNNV